MPISADELAEVLETSSARVALMSVVNTVDAVIHPILEKTNQTATNDQTMIKLHGTILNGFPNDKCNLPLSLRPYWCVHDRLCIDDTDGRIMLGSRVVIPESLCRDFVHDLVAMHQGSTKLHQ